LKTRQAVEDFNKTSIEETSTFKGSIIKKMEKMIEDVVKENGDEIIMRTLTELLTKKLA